MKEFSIAANMAFAATDPAATDEAFEAFLDQVLVQFDNIGRDVSLAARLSERVADFQVTIKAADFESALIAFLVDLRTALHAAGCSTAGWPQFRPTDRVVRELQDA